MGVSTSRPVDGRSYSEQAALAKALPDQILSLFFSNATLMKLLELHTIGNCPNFIFTTSDELSSLFLQLQIEPKLGKKGEILFAPVSEVAPGSVKNAASQPNVASKQEKIHYRNKLCTDVGYFYVRVFQIYAALALTVIDADPSRRSKFSTVNPYESRPGPRSSPLGGGARLGPLVGSGPLLSQRGGRIPASGPQKQLYDSMKLTAIEPLMPLLTLSRKSDSNSTILEFEDNRQGKTGTLYLRWTWPNTSDITLDGEFIKTGGQIIPISFSVSKTSSNSVEVLTIIVNGGINTVDQELKKKLSTWEFVYDNFSSSRPNEPYGFFDKIYKAFPLENKNVSSNRPRSGSNTGISSFTGFKDLKELFVSKTKGAEFPKAYCMARLMTLIDPVFVSEKQAGIPYMSQICKKKYDFETKDYMPRVGDIAKNNIYIKSFVALFYDDYQYVRGQTDIKLTMSEPRKSDLRKASIEFGRMYSIKEDQPTFLFESGGEVKFTEFETCVGKTDRPLRIKDDKIGKDFMATLQKEFVKRMLDYQVQHTAKVNNILKKMFKIETIVDKNKVSQTVLKLQPAIKAAGKDGINAIGNEVKDLLLNYYRESEAFYVLGVNFFKDNKNAYDVI